MSPAQRLAIPEKTRLAQERASDPRGSAWVSANAGSGKTHVLTQRVLRLLLDGAPPSRILCLTFTKAAAANMSARVFKSLADWTRLDDDALAQAIRATGAPSPDEAGLRFARKLFARTIESPGGLKIQTIHAFCERLLHLFPFEANVAAGFRVVEDREARELLQGARELAFVEAERDADLAASLQRIADIAGPEGFDPLLTATLSRCDDLAVDADASLYARQLRARLGLADDDSDAKLAHEILTGAAERWPDWARLWRTGTPTDIARAATLAALAAPEDEAAAAKNYLGLFFTRQGNGTPTKQLGGAALFKRAPEFQDELEAEQLRLDALRDRWRAATALERSRALAQVAEAVRRHYTRLKNARGWLDFDDLIVRTLALLSNTAAAWVLYKLDSGIDHILIDEAQDTSPAQWDILRRIAADFLDGEGARHRTRTFFAVGDEKQSIFSFQGAAPDMFDAMRREFKARHDRSRLPFEVVRLDLSFRSSPWVLGSVDRVFAVEEVWRGVSAAEAQAPPHAAFHQALPGLVEVWAPIKAETAPESGDWRMPLDAASRRDPAVALADRIALTIQNWLSPRSNERVVDVKSGATRRIRAGDILILVRSRGPLFEALTRALLRARIASAGADKLILRDHIAVMDLVAVGRAALGEDDDLALAAALKSPLGGLDDDDLMRFAPGRAGSLAAALVESAAEADKRALARLVRWRKRARSLSAFDFYARLLGADGGRKALLGRLGPEAADAIDEFMARALARERQDAPSLVVFLAEIEAADAAIKRDMETEGDSVRVMTVHAAKGLEAPIVFLPDTCSGPTGRHDPDWLALAPRNSSETELFVYAPKSDDDGQALAPARLAARALAEGEHRRLLYVAMTRAAQRLIVAGFEGARERPANCWHNLIRLGLDGVLKSAPAPWDATQEIWRVGEGPNADPAFEAPPRTPAEPPPEWLRRPAAAEAAPEPLAPSRVALQTAPSADRRARLEAGRLAHTLVQELADVAPDARAAAAARLVESQGDGVLPERRDEIAARAIALLSRPDLAPLFGPGSRAEVAIAGSLLRPGEPDRVFVGRIDRLAVLENEAILADFKSGAGKDVPPEAYIAQLALYRAALLPLLPDKPLRACLVWLDSERCDWISPETLDDALEKMRGTAPTR